MNSYGVLYQYELRTQPTGHTDGGVLSFDTILTTSTQKALAVSERHNNVYQHWKVQFKH